MTKSPEDPKAGRGAMGRVLRILIMLVLACLLVAAGFGAGYLYFDNPMSPSQNVLQLLEKKPEESAGGGHGEEDGTPHKVSRPEPENGGYVTSYYTMAEPLTSNLKDSRRFLQLTIAVATEYDAKILEQVKAHEPALRADALKVISGYSEEDLKSAEGRDRLAADLLAAINARLKELEGFAGIKEVIFPALVMQ